MPQLEIHHEDGNVTYAELSPSKPLMVGSAANCDIVLASPDVKRVHCRIVHRDGRWRVEVAADAGSVQLGDKSVKAGTIRGGDVLGIAGFRIYMDDATAAAPAAEPEHYASDVLTSATAADESAAPEVLGRGSIRKKAHMQDTRGFGAKLWESIRRTTKEQLQGEVDRPPGQERILGSPLVRWMGLAVLVIGVGGVWFYLDYRNRTINDHFDSAQQMMVKGDWDGAIRRFEDFIKLYPSHGLTSSATVQREMCEVESTAAGSPTGGLGKLRGLLREQVKEPAFPGLVPKIAELAGRLAQALATAARDKADPKLLEQSEEAQEMLRSSLSAGNPPEDVLAKLAQTMDEARAAIKEADTFFATRDTMDRAIASGTTRDVYAARERLLVLYPKKFDDHADIEERMRKAQTLDRERVQWVAGIKNAETTPREGAIIATTVFVDRREQGSAPAGTGDVAFCIAGGRVTAHNVANGTQVWSIVVGADARWLPVTLPNPTEPTVLVTDTRHDELIAVHSRNGQLVWRQPIGEPLEAAPLVHKNKIYQPTGKGNIVVIDVATGRIDGRLQFGEQRLYTTPVADETGQHLFVLGEQYVFYVITLSAAPKCDSLVYLAHRPDSIIAAPLRMQRYLVLFENDTATACQMRVFLLSTDGATLEEIQAPKEKLPGWVHHVPAVVGNIMFIATDLEIVEVWSGGAPEKREGYKKETTAGQVSTLAGTRPQAYSLAYTEKDLLVIGSKMRHYDYKKEQQVLAPSQEKLEGAAVQPIQRYPATGRVELLFVARRIPGSSSVQFTAIDAATLAPRWDVQLSAGLLSLQPADAANSAWVALTKSGQVYSIPAASLAAGGVLDKPVARSADAVELSDRVPPVLLADGSSVYAPSGTSNSLFTRAAAATAPIVPLELPAAAQASVVLYQDGILVPAADGRVYWLSPATKKQLADPFQPPLTSDQSVEWRGIGLSAQKTIVAADSRGNIFQIELLTQPTTHLTAKGETKLPKRIRSAMAISGKVVCCVDEENTLHTLDAETLATIATVKLSNPASLGPVAAGGHIFVVVGDDEFVCVNAEGQVAWRQPLKGETVTGRPLVKDDAVHFVTTSGLIRALRLADGSELWTLNAEIPLAGGPVAAAAVLVVVGEDGSLNVVKAPAAGN